MWDMIAKIPDHRLSVYFDQHFMLLCKIIHTVVKFDYFRSASTLLNCC